MDVWAVPLGSATLANELETFVKFGRRTRTFDLVKGQTPQNQDN